MSGNSHRLLIFFIVSLTAHVLLMFFHAPSAHYAKPRSSGQQWLSVSLSPIGKNATSHKGNSKVHTPKLSLTSNQSAARTLNHNDSAQRSSRPAAHLMTQYTTRTESLLKRAAKALSQQTSIKSKEATQRTILKELKQEIITSNSNPEHQLAQQNAQRNFLLGEIQNRLLRNMYYPVRARKRGWEGEVTVSFHIDKNGNLHNIHLVQTSGYALLDRAALIAVRKVNNIPVSRWGEDFTPVALKLPVIYRLTNS